MADPIKNNQTPPPSTDPYSKSYGDPYGGDYGNSGYDPNMGEGSGGVPTDSYSGYESGNYGDYGDFSDFLGGEGDLGVEGGEEGMPGDGSAPAPVTEESVRAMLRDLQGSMSDDDYRAFQGRINATTGMSPERAAAELQAIAGELNMIANPDTGMVGEDGQPVSTEAHDKEVADFKSELEKYRDDIMDMDNLTEAEKTEFAGAVDKMINDIELAEKDPAKMAEIDVASLTEDLNEIKTGVDTANQHSQGVKSLADLAGMTPEELAAKAEAAGIDLDNVSVPPSMDLLNFLMEVSPELKSKIEAVETAVDARAKSIEDTTRLCNEQNNANDTNDTSAQDNTSMANFQALLDLRYHQDDKSKAVADAMKAVTDALCPLLEALYPGQEVKVVESSGLSGWEKTNQDFLNADKISIGGTTIDLFGSADGKIHSTTTADDPDPATEVPIPTILYDGSGDGSWHPRKSDFNLYGETDLATQWTDDNENQAGNEHGLG